jgi:hypothetical protein
MVLYTILTSSASRLQVSTVIRACLQFNPADRPTAIQLGQYVAACQKVRMLRGRGCVCIPYWKFICEAVATYFVLHFRKVHPPFCRRRRRARGPTFRCLVAAPALRPPCRRCRAIPRRARPPRTTRLR